MTIKQFFITQNNLPKKQKQKFVKLFVGKDRQHVEHVMEHAETLTEKDLLELWRTKYE